MSTQRKAYLGRAVHYGAGPTRAQAAATAPAGRRGLARESRMRSTAPCVIVVAGQDHLRRSEAWSGTKTMRVAIAKPRQPRASRPALLHAVGDVAVARLSAS